MKIVAISDTHNRHRDITIPECDLLIHAGDATMLGTKKEMEDFAEWFTKQPAKRKVFVPGNHEVGYYHDFSWHMNRCIQTEGKTITLIDDFVNIDRKKFYGSPWTYVSPKWGFQFPWYEKDGSKETQKNTWAAIPEDVEILVTHAPPYGILDLVPPRDLHHIDKNDPFYRMALAMSENCGDKILMEEIKKRPKLKYHFFGHIHEGYGHKEVDGVHFYNVAICDRSYKASNPVTVIEI